MEVVGQTFSTKNAGGQAARFWILLAFLLGAAFLLNWIEAGGESRIPRRSLAELPKRLGAWQQLGLDTRFSAAAESVLRADDYLLRDYYVARTGQSANVYVGYYNSQRTGATYHSPRNCLPGSGWTMTEAAPVAVRLPNGTSFLANSYRIENDNHKSLMIYWYQGRGRHTANEYLDKFYTVWDGFLRRRSDAALVRVVTALGDSEQKAEQTALDLSEQLAAELPPFVPN